MKVYLKVYLPTFKYSINANVGYSVPTFSFSVHRRASSVHFEHALNERVP
jgi:hypothetical protein